MAPHMEPDRAGSFQRTSGPGWLAERTLHPVRPSSCIEAERV